MEEIEIDQINHIFLKKYEICEKLGSGATSKVYKIRQRQTQNIYALKISELGKIKNWKGNQFKVLNSIAFDGVVKVYKDYTDQKYQYLIIEYLQKNNLSTFLKWFNNIRYLKQEQKNKVLKIILTKILQIISYLHSKGIVHRDLKLENFSFNSNYQIKLIDFTFSYSQNQYIQQTNQPKTLFLIGSPHYISPQSLKCPITLPSQDVWSFGILIYVLHHGYFPFNGKNNFYLFQSIKKDKAFINPQLPEQVKEIISQCLQKDYKKRKNITQIKNTQYFIQQIKLNLHQQIKCLRYNQIEYKSTINFKTKNQQKYRLRILSFVKKEQQFIILISSLGKQRKIAQIVIRKVTKLTFNQSIITITTIFEEYFLTSRHLNKMKKVFQMLIQKLKN